MADRNDDVREDEDLGEPVSELLELAEEPSAGFLSRIVSSIQRRNLASNFATLAWSAAAVALFEFLRMIFSAFEPRGSRQGDDD